MRNKSYEQIANEIESFISNRTIAGSVLLAADDRLLINKAFGYANREKKIPNTPSTVYYIASLTKPFTAAAILILEEQGKLSTTDKLSKYLPKFKNGKSITIHNLLSHSTGLTEYNTNEIADALDSRFSSPDDFFPIIEGKSLKFKPGEKFEYCNSNYILLGHIIEIVSGMKYESFVTEKILYLSDMNHSSFGFTDASDNQALGYDSTVPGFSTLTPDFMEKLFILGSSPGGLRSTVEDLYLWDKSLNSHRILKAESLNKMYTPYAEHYAYGWGISKPLPHVELVHNGSLPGFSSHIYSIPDDQLFFAILSNSAWSEDFNQISSYFFQFLG
jgi:CubicO group peptidase (beta-lactamase class C family)